jgi:hypothetical protein
MRGSTERINAYARKIKRSMTYDAMRLRIATAALNAIISKHPPIVSREVGEQAFNEEVKRTASGAVTYADQLLKELGYVRE